MNTLLRTSFAAGFLLTACIKPIDDQPDSASGATSSAAGNVATTPGTTAPIVDPAMHLEVDVTARKLYVHRNGAPADTHSVAVGTQEWPTQTGEFRIIQVVWNPDWIPPQEEWAKDEEKKESGDPENPLGRAQLVYDPPRSIHGTNEPNSIGKAASHGSIRMRNEDIVELARAVMEAGGVQRDAAFFEQVRTNRRTKQVVDLTTPIPIRIR